MLSSRQKKILRAIVHSYINDAEPVGSRTLTRRYDMDLSPATVRNVMQELEESEYIARAHISSGRIPTDKGYRFYIDTIAELNRLSDEEEMRISEIRAVYEKKREKVNNLLREATRTLSEMTGCAGIISSPLKDLDTSFTRIHLLPIDSCKVLAALVTTGGLVMNYVLETAGVPSRRSLEHVSRKLSARSGGFTLDDVLDSISIADDREMKRLESLINSLKSMLGEEVDNNDDVMVEGYLKLFDHPEFQDMEQVRLLLKLLEDRETLRRILHKRFVPEDVNVIVGAENLCDEFRDLSVVFRSFNALSSSGSVGIIGPRRMDYPRIMSLVGRLADQLSRILAGEDIKH